MQHTDLVGQMHKKREEKSGRAEGTNVLHLKKKHFPSKRTLCPPRPKYSRTPIYHDNTLLNDLLNYVLCMFLQPAWNNDYEL